MSYITLDVELDEEIKEIPEVPEEIKTALEHRKLVLFLGAGISAIKPIKCPLWKAFSDQLVDEVLNERDETDKAYIKNLSNKQKIQICKSINPEKYYDAIQSILKCKDPSEKQEQTIYELLKSKAVGIIFVTTNIDNHFSNLLSEEGKVIYRSEDFPKSPQPDCLYHLHGSINDKESLVLTPEEYSKRYNADNIKIFLKNLFNHYVVLFVGYGLEELEVLEFLFSKSSVILGKNKNHFILLPFQKINKNQLCYEKLYYDSLNINVIAYSKDKEGYEAIKNVSDKILREIASKNWYEVEEQKTKNAINKRDSTILKRIKEEPNLKDQAYFINSFVNRLCEQNNEELLRYWFGELKKQDFFSPSDNPKAFEKDGYIDIRPWPVLKVLERISKSLGLSDKDEALRNNIIAIADNVIATENDSKTRKENSHTNCLLLISIFNLPSSYIKKEHINFLSQTLQNSLMVSGLRSILLSNFLNHFFSKMIKTSKEYFIKDLWNILCKHADPYKAKRFLDQHAEDMVKLFSFQEIKQWMDERVINLDFSFSYALSNVMEEAFIHCEPKSREALYHLYLFIKVLMFYTPNTDISYKDFLKSSLNKDISNFPDYIDKKCAIYALAFHYETSAKAKKLFRQHLRKEWLVNAHIKKDLAYFLEKNVHVMQTNDLNHFINLIEKTSEYEPKKNLLHRQGKIAELRLKWLRLLESSKDSEMQQRIKNLINKYKSSIASADPILLSPPHARNWDTPIIDKSHLSVEEILKMPHDKLIEFLKKAQDSHPSDLEPKGTVELSESLKEAVNKNPQKFIQDLAQYIQVPILYWQGLLKSFEKCAKNQQQIEPLEWKNVLDFITLILEKINLESINTNEGNMITCIGKLLESLTKVISVKKDKDLYQNIGILLIDMANKTPSQKSYNTSPFSEENAENSKSLSSVSHDWFIGNSNALGSVLLAIISFLENLEKEAPFFKEMENLFKEKLLDPNRLPEFSFFAGQYLYERCFLEENFFDREFEKIFPKEGQPFIDTMAGYLESSYRFFSNPFYKRLKDKNYYNLALDQFNYFVAEAQTSLCRHIFIGYIRKYDFPFEKSLLKTMLERKNFQLLCDCLSFFDEIASFQERNFFIPEGLKVFRFINDIISNNQNFYQLEQRLFCFSTIIEDWNKESQGLMKKILVNLRDIDKAIEILNIGIQKTEDQERLKVLRDFTCKALDRDTNLYSFERKELLSLIIEKLNKSNLPGKAEDIEAICKKWFIDLKV